jgi:Fur family transcriptional regulator, peroxide stress response regulator
MTNPDVRFNELITALKERNYRLTPQRVELVRLIAVSEGHPSANQFYEEIQLKFPTISQSTVYKTLALLKEMNQVYEIDLREDSRYDGNRPQPHPHLICMNCNKIVDGEVALDMEAIKKVEQASGFTILRPQISLYGYCPDCRKGS